MTWGCQRSAQLTENQRQALGVVGVYLRQMREFAIEIDAFIDRHIVDRDGASFVDATGVCELMEENFDTVLGAREDYHGDSGVYGY